MRFSVTNAANPTADPLPRAIRDAIRRPRAERTPAQQAAIFSCWRTNVGPLKAENDAIEALWSRYPEGDSVLNLEERRGARAQRRSLLTRGDWQPAKRIAPGAGASPRVEDAPRTHLAWARQIDDPHDGAIVNRVWQSYFGNGLVETPEDFGIRAPEPTHPELLDWLAVEFMDRGWSFKELHRIICNSATYRQSSRVTPELLERDPRNRLLARGARFRAEAEVVRDITLCASGLLSEKVGGPSVFPPVPDGLFALSFIPVNFWNVATGADRYRRALYTFRRRSIPDPVLASFDAPNGDLACIRRARSNTPLAALASLNGAVFVEAAQALAMRTLRDGGTTEGERAAFAFRLCTSRSPGPPSGRDPRAAPLARGAHLAGVGAGENDRVPEPRRDGQPARRRDSDRSRRLDDRRPRPPEPRRNHLEELKAHGPSPRPPRRASKVDDAPLVPP